MAERRDNMKRTSLFLKAGISWRNSLFTRITVTFIAILLPLYILGIFIYNSAMESVRTEIKSSMVSQVTFYTNGLEEEVKRLRSLQFDLINDLYLNRLAAIPKAMNSIEKVQAILILQNRLEAIRSSSLYISNFIVYIPSIDRIVTDRHVDEMDTEKFKALNRLYKQDEMVTYDNGTPVILVESPYMDNDTGEPMYILDIELDKQAFRDALYQFDKYPGSGSFLINTKASQNIATANISETVENQIIENIKNGGQGIVPVESNNKTSMGMYIYTASEPLGMTLCMYVPEEVVFKPIKQYQVWFYIFTLAAVAVIGSFSFSMYRFIHKPLIELVNAFGKVEEGDLGLSIEHHHKDEFRYLYRRFNAMVENLGNLIKQVYTMKILTQKAELKQLQSQINPHFLYNSFFILHRRIKGGDYDNAITFSQQLGNYFRFITRSADDEVPLEREVEHARIYSDIQIIRFSSRISADFEPLPEDCKNIIVPRLILQPIIENAFEHGLENKTGGGILHIGFAKGDGHVTIIMEDNGEDLKDAEIERLKTILAGEDSSAESTGIINIHRRLQLKFGMDYGISVSRSPLGGFRAELRISTAGGDKNV